MKHPGALMMTSELASSATRLVERLGDVEVRANLRWRPVAVDLGLAANETAPVGTAPRRNAAVPIVVGSPADVEAHARVATAPFGFVMPVAQTWSAPWRGSSWRDDATLALWRLGFSTMNIDRLVVAAGESTVEMAIGDVRPIPELVEPDFS